MRASPTKFRTPESLKGCTKIPYCTYRKYRPSCRKIQPLLNLCQPVIDAKPEPAFWFMSVEDVADFVANQLGHPELKEALIINNIDGPSLVFLEADKFPKMNITDFDLIKELTAGIRNLCNLDQDDFNRSISLTPRRPEVLFLLYKSYRSGPTSYLMSPVEYFKMIKLIRDETTEERRYYDLLNHWNRIPPFRPWCPHVLIGDIRRINVMTGTTQRANRTLSEGPFILKDLCLYHVSRQERKKLMKHCKCRFDFKI